MARFCLATWKLAAAVPGSGESAEPIAALGADTIAVEVVNEGDEFAVLFSVVDQVDRPENLECRIGFVNGTKACSVWRDRGFPLVDATIEWKGDLLQVTTPFFGADPGTMQYEGLFISIKGVHFEDGVLFCRAVVDAEHLLQSISGSARFGQPRDDRLPASRQMEA